MNRAPHAIRPNVRRLDPHERAMHEDEGDGKTREQEDTDRQRMLAWVLCANLLAVSVGVWVYWSW